MSEEVTIISVFYSPETRRLQELNKKLTDRINPKNTHKWLFAENSKDKREISPVQFPGNNSKVLPGVAGWRDDVISWIKGSFNHACGLQILLSSVETRFVICTEPDFFVIRPNWISEVIQTMKDKNLSFFGAPYDPRRYTMYRYFPHIAFIAMDLGKIDKSKIDFTPTTSYLEDNAGKTMRYFLKRLKKKLLGARSAINTRRDTGGKIYERFRNEPSECLKPVFNRKMNLFDKILPDGLSFVPHKAGYFTAEGFSKHGLPDFKSQFNWEEYTYKNSPFAFHMQGGKEKKDMEKELQAVINFIASIE